MDDPAGNKMLLVMDYMEGGPVLTREGLERGRRIPEPLSLQYFRDMCKVRYAQPLHIYSAISAYIHIFTLPLVENSNVNLGCMQPCQVPEKY